MLTQAYYTTLVDRRTKTLGIKVCLNWQKTGYQITLQHSVIYKPRITAWQNFVIDNDHPKYQTSSFNRSGELFDIINLAWIKRIDADQQATSDLLKLFSSGDFILGNDSRDGFPLFDSDWHFSEVINTLDGVTGYYETDNLFHFWTESIEL